VNEVNGVEVGFEVAVVNSGGRLPAVTLVTVPGLPPWAVPSHGTHLARVEL